MFLAQAVEKMTQAVVSVVVLQYNIVLVGRIAMHIAICDDEQKELLHLQTLVMEFDSCVNVSLFLSSDELLDSAQSQHFDIVLLDIEMSGLNGFTAATQLVKMQNPPLIVFVTNSSEYTLRGYGIAFRYLLKPVSYVEMADVLTSAITMITPQKLTFDINGSSHFVSINDIMYFESFGHHLVVHTRQNNYECRMKLCDVEALLPGNAFVSPHKGFLVNLDFVDMVGENELLLTCSIKIPISRRRKQEFEQALFRFVRRSR